MTAIDPQKQIELRSPEVQDIIGRPPPGLVRWGMSVLFLVLATTLACTWFIKYPDTLSANVMITTSPPPLALVTRTNGSIVFLKDEKDHVDADEMIAYVETGVSPEVVLDLETAIENDDLPDKSAMQTMDELEDDYAALQSAALALKTFNDATPFDVQIRQLRRQEATVLRLQSVFRRQWDLARKELVLAGDQFSIDSALFVQNIKSRVDFNESSRRWLQQQSLFSSAEERLLNNETQINQLRKQISDLEFEKLDQRERLGLTYQNCRSRLLAHIAQWKERYLFLSPMEGRIAYFGFVESGMFVESGRELVVIIPEGDLVAHADLPLHNSGKVKQGQVVNIRLHNYPFEQYGVVKGLVASVSLVPSEDKYFVAITLPHGLHTNLNQNLVFKQKLTGTAEIITEDLKLMERLLYQFRKIFNPVSTP